MPFEARGFRNSTSLSFIRVTTSEMIASIDLALDFLASIAIFNMAIPYSASSDIGSPSAGHAKLFPSSVEGQPRSWLYPRPRLDAPAGREENVALIDNRYMVVEGPIGVGKTSLANILAERFHARGVLEGVEQLPFLSSIHSNRQKYAFQTQLFFLLSRFRQQQELGQRDLFNSVTISDYLFDKDRIFACL